MPRSTRLAFLLVAFVLLAACASALSPFGRRRNNRARLSTISSSPLSGTPNTTRYFPSQRLDHFDPQNPSLWTQRYFVNDTFFDPDVGPVFLCVGGEGPPLEPTVVVTGDLHCAHMITIASQHKALILALEHRFYGESIPTPDFSTKSLRFLTSRQALADISVFHDFIVSSYGLTSNKWVTFGGSYPGMLAAWARLKYPGLIHAAISSSSPVRAIVNFQGYNDVVAASLASPLVGGSSLCVGAVINAFAALGAELGYPYGRRSLESMMNVCGNNTLEDTHNQQQFLQTLFDFFPVQTNDPSCTDPGCNIESVCDIMLDGSHVSTLGSLSYLVSLAMGGDCLDVSYDEYVASLLNTTVAGGVERIWTYETCNEFAFYQTCDPGSQCPFTTQPWLDTLQFSLDLCSLAFNISADQVNQNVAATNAYYGADHPTNTSRILFVNGDIDPWHAMSVLEPLSPLLPALVVPGASHHAWTHPAQPTDSPAIVKVRQQITSYVLQWLAMDP